MEVGGWWGATEVAGFSMCWSWPARRSHLRPIWALDITNSSQFDGQAFWPVVWRFPSGWILVYSHHCHLKTTRALKHVIQAWENSPKKSRPVKYWQWHTYGSLVHWCSNWFVVKSVPCHLVRTRPVFANLVTFVSIFSCRLESSLLLWMLDVILLEVDAVTVLVYAANQMIPQHTYFLVCCQIYSVANGSIIYIQLSFVMDTTM